MQPTTTPAPGKRRKRWKLLAGFAIFLVAAPLAFYFVSGWLAERRMAEIYRELDAQDHAWRWHDLVATIKPPPDDENSAVQILQINGLLKKTPFVLGPIWTNAPKDPLIHRNARLSAEPAAQLRRAFDKLDPLLLAKIRNLKDMPRGCFVIEAVDKPFIQLNFDYVQPTRTIVHLLQLDAALRAQEDDCDGAAESCQAILNTTASLRDHPFLIPHLVRCAEHAIAVGAIERTLGQGTVSEATLKKLQTLLEEEAANDGLYAGMRGERAGGQQMCELLQAGKSSFSEWMGAARASVGMPERLLDAFPGVVLNGYPDYLRTMTEQVEAAKLPYPERAATMRKIEEKEREKRTMLSSMIMPATRKVTEATQRNQGWLRCAIVGIAAERYRQKHERWPSKLDDLVQAGFLKEVPKDPYDGQPLRLARTPTGIIVYSVGIDLVDNGGKLDRANPHAPGIDLGFELWHDFPGRRLRGVAPPVE